MVLLKWILREIGRENMSSNELAQNLVQWWTSEVTVLNLEVLISILNVSLN
jgi:hypothetical protein